MISLIKITTWSIQVGKSKPNIIILNLRKYEVGFDTVIHLAFLRNTYLNFIFLKTAQFFENLITMIRQYCFLTANKLES